MARSPTRLEGMETSKTSSTAMTRNWSPTRLEGMETIDNRLNDIEGVLSPTRLEGMETIALLSRSFLPK